MPKARALAKVEQGEQRGEISGGESVAIIFFQSLGTLGLDFYPPLLPFMTKQI